jgi:fatty acid synthase, animal type
VVSEQIVDNRIFILLRRNINIEERVKQFINVTEKNFEWLDELKESLVESDTGKFIYIVCQGEEYFGAVGLMNCIKNEAGGKMARLIFIQDKNALKFDINEPLYAEQMKKDLIQVSLKLRAFEKFYQLFVVVIIIERL